MICSYCTLFDSNYLAKGLAMYYSLLKHCNSFCLYIFAFDKKTEIVLKKMDLKNVVVVSLKDLEDEDLLAVKSSRTNAEYFWTCSSATIWYCMKNFNVDICTYVDADLFFFSDPSILLDEMGDDDVLITEHRYTSQYDFTSLTGIYCVQFMSFKNTTNGLSVLNWWRSECLKWCYDRFEDGKYGDQKYLDDWPTRFTGIHVLQHLGGGMAPWNMQQYEIKFKNNVITGRELVSQNEFLVIFFHFHYVYCKKKHILREFLLTHPDYLFPDTTRSIIYAKYLPVLKACYKLVKKIDPSIDGLGMKELNDSWWMIFKRLVKGFITGNNYFAHWIDIS